MLIHATLAFALFETLALAGVLLWWADRVAGARLLAAFLTGIAVWITGNELPNWFGPGVERLTMALLAGALLPRRNARRDARDLEPVLQEGVDPGGPAARHPGCARRRP